MSNPSPRPPSDFADPTFTPLRDEEGNFSKVPPPPEQKKKDQSDPDWHHINPEIIRLAQRNGMVRGCLNQYLTGELNWMETLEVMVVALGKELLVNQEILVDQRNEYVGLHRVYEELMAHPALVSSGMDLPEERAHQQFFIGDRK